jgi:hypothetical protein
MADNKLMQMTLKVAALKADKKLMQIASKSAAMKADESGCIASKAAAPTQTSGCIASKAAAINTAQSSCLEAMKEAWPKANKSGTNTKW